jgi:hypothetical protein
MVIIGILHGQTGGVRRYYQYNLFTALLKDWQTFASCTVKQPLRFLQLPPQHRSVMLSITDGLAALPACR